MTTVAFIAFCHGAALVIHLITQVECSIRVHLKHVISIDGPKQVLQLVFVALSHLFLDMRRDSLIHTVKQTSLVYESRINGVLICYGLEEVL